MVVIDDIGYQIILVLIPVVATSSIASFTIHYAKKSHQKTAMMDTFHMLNKDEEKQTEDKIIELFKNGSLNGNLRDPHFYNQVRKVWRNYDQLGLLTTKNLIPKKEFYLLFGLKMVALYFCSSSEIERRRLTRPGSLGYFTNMAIDCFEFYKKRKIPIINPATNGDIQRSDLGEKIKL